MRGIINKNGVAAVIIPAPKAIDKRVFLGQSEAEAVADIVEAAEPGAVVVPLSVIPVDRKWRGAWVFESGEVKASSTSARLIALDRLRVLRDKEMAAADVDFTVALGRKNQSSQDAAEARRESLRLSTEPLKNWTPGAAVLSLVEVEAQLSPLEVLPV